MYTTNDQRRTNNRIYRMNYCQAVLAVLAVFFTSVAMAEDFKTLNGKEYKNATISRVEPDGIALITKTGVSKIYFTELPKEVQQRFHYDPVKAAQFNAAERAAIAELNAKEQQDADAKAKAAKAQLEEAQWEAQARQAAEAQSPRPPVGGLTSVGGGGNLPQTP